MADSQVSITLKIDGRAVDWKYNNEDPGWDAYIHGEEAIDLDALTHNGVFTHIANLLTHPEAIK